MKSEIEGERVRRMKVRSGGWCLCVHTWCKGCVTGRLRHSRGQRSVRESETAGQLVMCPVLVQLANKDFIGTLGVM